MVKRFWVVLLLVMGCGTETADRYDIVLITIDTIRADRLGCYCYFRDTSPNLDRLASEALVFERCFAPMATTLPAHLSLMTGTYPDEHSVLANAADGGRRFVPNPSLRTFAEFAALDGYETAAFVSATPLKKHTGIQAGFRSFREPSRAECRAEETTDAALAWLDQALPAPHFLWVHYFDPHGNYDPPAPFDDYFHRDPALIEYFSERQFYRGQVVQGADTLNTAEITNRYDAEVRYLDSQIGRLLERLQASGRWDRTILIIAGDHGEGLGQHGEIHHGSIWNEQLHVPLIVRVPGGTKGRDATLLSLVDVMPMITGFLDWETAPLFLAQASSRFGNERAPQSGFVLSQASPDVKRAARVSDTYALTTPHWKYVHSEGGDLLFDRRRDPFELQDIAAQYPDTVMILKTALISEIAARDRNSERFWEGRPDRPDSLSAKTIEELRSLGYVK